ncbi:TetR family transcriptional regulator [Sporosarcina sp. P19]|uniref:TetR/AcrR family transcriptional regulator n=1 Tax=Sporosarcina sp. P19 TaxID=2048258 RepID=UPI000C17037A|nr:TetR/AcrR family transcriptional regulator [Sporosarcina sp. P19]PIC77994.1 TetR family transcriptional regulator [Sporosarcina sp. P19]
MKKSARQIQAEQTKKRILETALELFRKKGFDNVTVDEIVKKSESSKGAFYGHFSSKYDIFMEKFKEIDQYYIKVVSVMPETLTFNEKVLYLVERQMHYLEFELGKDMMRTVYVSGLMEREGNFFSIHDRGLYTILDEFIVTAIKEGNLPENTNNKALIRMLSRCMRGLLYDWLSLGNEYNLDAESKMFFSTFLAGLQCAE